MQREIKFFVLIILCIFVTMDLIKDLGIKKMTDGRLYRTGIFKCPVCFSNVEKIKRDGLKAKQCSHKCYAKKREKRGAYKTKVIISKYRYVYMPTHPKAIGTKKLYVAEHRLIMENILGRYLTDKEIVHHINEDTMDNSIENLQLMTASEHSKYHSLKRNKDKNGKFKI